MTYTIKTTDEIKNNIVLNLITNVDEINDANVGSTMDLFVTSMSQELGEQYEDIETVYNSTRITTATNSDLEEIGLIVGIQRTQGVKANTNVAFKRDAPASSTFTIPVNTIVSTQPNTGDLQYKFLVVNSTLFPSSISNETKTFRNGIYYYKLNSRFFDSVTTLNAEVSSTPTDLVLDTDYEIVDNYNDILLSAENLEVLDDCEATTDWTNVGADTANITTNSSIFIEGTKGLNLMKSGATINTFGYSKDLGSGNEFDITTKSVFTFLNIVDSGTLAKISKIELIVASDSSFANSYTVEQDFELGWNTLVIDRNIPQDLSISGNPDYKNLRYLKILITTNTTTDTVATAKIVMDFWNITTYEMFEGNVIHFLTTGDLPDDDSTMTFDYVPLSVEVLCTAENVGSDYNVSAKKIEYLASALSNINSVLNYSIVSNGIDIENDTDLRFRIQRAADIANVSTVNAIQFNVLGLDFIQTCEVVDTPLTLQEDEACIYNATTKKIILSRNVAIDSDNLVVSDTSGGSADYVKNTDYQITDNNELDFDLGGDEPGDGDTVYVTYNYNKLGWFNVGVSGVLGALTEFELDEVEEVVEEKKAAGTKYIISEPTYDVVSIEATITTTGSYSLAEIQDNISAEMIDYVNKLNIGDDVLLAGLIQKVMVITGVANISITSLVSDAYPSSTGDLVVDSGHKATLIINNITLS